MRTTSISAWEIKQHLKAVANLEGFNILFQACVSCCMEAGQSLWWDVEDKSIQGSAVVTPLSFLQRPDINSAATIICPPTQKPIISISGKKHHFHNEFMCVICGSFCIQARSKDLPTCTNLLNDNFCVCLLACETQFDFAAVSKIQSLILLPSNHAKSLSATPLYIRILFAQLKETELNFCTFWNFLCF